MKKLQIPTVKLLRILFTALSVVLVASSVNAQVVQFSGSNRDGIFSDSMLLKEWTENGPEVLVAYNISKL